MKSKKQIRHRNKSKKFRKMKGAGGRFSMPMTTLTPQERQEALTMRAPTARELAQQYSNTELLRRVGSVLQQQQGFHELAILGSATSGVIDRKSAQRMKKDYMKSEAYLKSETYLNKVKKGSKELWDEMYQSDLELIFGDFMNIYNNKRPEDSKLFSTDPQNNSYLYFQFTKHASAEYQKSIDEIYKHLVIGDIADFQYNNKRQFFDDIENEILFYESILEAISNYMSGDKIMVRDGVYGTQYYLVENDGQEDESWIQLNSHDPNDVYQDQYGNIDVITNPEFISALNDPRNGYRRVFVGGKKRGKKSIKNKKLKTKKRKTRRRRTRKH